MIELKIAAMAWLWVNYPARWMSLNIRPLACVKCMAFWLALVVCLSKDISPTLSNVIHIVLSMSLAAVLGITIENFLVWLRK